LEDNRGYGRLISKSLNNALNFLWTIEREAKLITKESEDFSKENKLRKVRRLPIYSPIHTMSIDREELRRVEFHRAAEIADAIKNKGGYKIPGLVLVGKYTKPSSGTVVESYARCEDEIVRTMATEFLRSENYEDLAELVRGFGHRTTQDQFGLSRLTIPRLR